MEHDGATHFFGYVVQCPAGARLLFIRKPLKGIKRIFNGIEKWIKRRQSHKGGLVAYADVFVVISFCHVCFLKIINH